MSISVNPKRAKKKILKAKSRARPELLINSEYDEWTCMELAKTFSLNLHHVACRDTLRRVNVKSLKYNDFVEQFERPQLPVVITGVTESWSASDKWTLDYFVKKFRNERFKCGEDDHGYNVKMKMKYFVHYMETNCDDSPLYIFDGSFGEHRRLRELVKDYRLPEYFQEDLFRFAGETRRPPYRWIVIGSPRSGTGIHIDPLGTSAWNALLSGYKRWCLFPTTTPRELVKLSPAFGWKQSSEAIQWFNMVYPRTQEVSWPREYQPIEILQRPGETVFVPSGWWHVVLNMTDTIAVTQNFVSTVNFPIVWHKTRRSRPKLSNKWLSELEIHRPDLAKLTKSIDLNSPIGITSDSSSGSSSSSSSSSCSCSSCNPSESEDSGKASLTQGNKERRDSESRSSSSNSR